MKVNRRSLLTTAGGMAAAIVGTGWNPAHAQSTASPGGEAGCLAYRSVSDLRAMLDARQISAMELLERAVFVADVSSCVLPYK